MPASGGFRLGQVQPEGFNVQGTQPRIPYVLSFLHSAGVRP